MESKITAIIEIGSNNTKTHIYKEGNLIYEFTKTIELKKNYQKEQKIDPHDWILLKEEIKKALEYTEDVHIYGCSIFRSLNDQELLDINRDLKDTFNLEVEVVSQEDEAFYTALGCFNNIDYKGKICIFIGGGGSIELLLVQNKKVIDKKYYHFGVVDITKKFDSLKADVPTCSFEEVYNDVKEMIGNIGFQADIFILAGGDHLYWYNNAQYELLANTLYDSENQKYMITRTMSDEYDADVFKTSLDEIRNRSDNPLWFDGSRAMKVITNLISHEIDAKYIIPTKINMEDGLKEKLL